MSFLFYYFGNYKILKNTNIWNTILSFQNNLVCIVLTIYNFGQDSAAVARFGLALRVKRTPLWELAKQNWEERKKKDNFQSSIISFVSANEFSDYFLSCSCMVCRSHLSLEFQIARSFQSDMLIYYQESQNCNPFWWQIEFAKTFTFQNHFVLKEFKVTLFFQ